VLDCLHETRAPFDPAHGTREIAKTLKAYGISKAIGDRYAASWVSGEFSRNDISYEASERDRSAVYADFLPLLTSGRARLLDSPRLVGQLCNLERRVSPKYISQLQDAWRTPIGGIGGAAHTTAPPGDQPDDDDNLSPRDRYIREISTAWQKPVGGGPRASIEALRQQRISPGARPGPGYRDASATRAAAKDAAAARAKAYDEYVDRISNAWRAR
jgi:hypothetical protein